ncbi:MAG: hypothetical protein ACKOEM_09980 [Planctomycetia bacterium]
MVKYMVSATGAIVAMLGLAFWAIDGGSIFAKVVCGLGGIATVAGLVPNLLRLCKEFVAVFRSLEVSIDHEVVAKNKAALARLTEIFVGGLGKLLIVLLVLGASIAGVALAVFFFSKVGSVVTSGDGWIAPRNKQSPGIHRIKVGVGDVIITRKAQGLSHINIRCNNGLVIKADWQVNPLNDFGYDLYEPEVNQTTNRMAVMMTTRGIIAAYLRGEYD